ncbi:MAG: RNA polymerase sigma factor [Parvularcula sp.]|nr:RNA polymerase sigma factor [Parvularcula sp.]
MSIRPRLARFIARLAFSQDEVEDLLQETFLNAHRAKGGENLEEPRAYLYRVARTVCYKSNRRRASFLERMVEDIDVEGLSGDRPDGVRTVEGRERLRLLARCLEDMPPRPREVFIMRHIEGLTYKEIASALGLAVSTVEKHLAKATVLMARMMDEPNSELPQPTDQQRRSP